MKILTNAIQKLRERNISSTQHFNLQGLPGSIRGKVQNGNPRDREEILSTRHMLAIEQKSPFLQKLLASANLTKYEYSGPNAVIENNMLSRLYIKLGKDKEAVSIGTISLNPLLNTFKFSPISVQELKTLAEKFPGEHRNCVKLEPGETGITEAEIRKALEG